VPAFRPAIFDRDVAALDIARFRQGLAQGGETAAHQIAWRRAAEKSDHRHRLLCARRVRPCDDRAAEKRDERASSHGSHGLSPPRAAGFSARPALISVLSLSTISADVAFGAPAPYQLLAS